MQYFILLFRFIHPCDAKAASKEQYRAKNLEATGSSRTASGRVIAHCLRWHLLLVADGYARLLASTHKMPFLCPYSPKRPKCRYRPHDVLFHLSIPKVADRYIRYALPIGIAALIATVTIRISKESWIIGIGIIYSSFKMKACHLFKASTFKQKSPFAWLRKTNKLPW